MALWSALGWLVIVAACGGNDGGRSDLPSGSTAPLLFTRGNWEVLSADPDRYIGTFVDIVGKISQTPKLTSEGTFWFMYVDPSTYGLQTVVTFLGQAASVSENEYVRVKGEVLGTFDGKNGLGESVRLPTLVAREVEVVDALAAAPRAIRTVDEESSQDQLGVVIILRKVEFATDETRIFVTVQNDSTARVLFIDFNAKAMQGDRQFDPYLTVNEDYPQVQAEIAPGAGGSGVIVFPPMDPDAQTRLILEAIPDDPGLTVAPYVFAIAGTSQ